MKTKTVHCFIHAIDSADALVATKTNPRIRSRNKMRSQAPSLWLATQLVLAVACGASFGQQVFVGGGTIYTGGTPVDPPHPLCPPPDPCVNQTIISSWYTGELLNKMVETYNGYAHLVTVDMYAQTNVGSGFKWVSSSTGPYDCGCVGGGIIAYNPTNWNNFLMDITNATVNILPGTNAIYFFQVTTPVPVATLNFYDLQAQTLSATYTNLALPMDGTTMISNTLPIGTVAAIAAFVPNGRLDSFFPFMTASNGIVPLQTVRSFSPDPQSPSLSSSSALTGGQATRGLVQLQDFSVIFVTGSVLSPPTIAVSASTLNGKNFVLTLAGPSNQPYSLLTTTNVAFRVASWTTVATGIFSTDPVMFTNASPTNPLRFYRGTSP